MIFGINTTSQISKSRLTAREITYNNLEISLVVFMPNITRNHAITYTNFVCVKESIFSCGFRWLVLVFSRGELIAHVTLYTPRSFLDVRIWKKNIVYFKLFLNILGAWNEMTNKGEYIVFSALRGKTFQGTRLLFGSVFTCSFGDLRAY